MGDEKKYSVEDKPQGLFESLFGGGETTEVVRDSSGHEVGTVEGKQPSLLGSLFGEGETTRVVRDSSGHEVGTVEDKQPGLLESMFGGETTRVVRDSSGHEVGTVEDKRPGFFESLFGTIRHRREINVDLERFRRPSGAAIPQEERISGNCDSNLDDDGSARPSLDPVVSEIKARVVEYLDSTPPKQVLKKAGKVLFYGAVGLAAAGFLASLAEKDRGTTGDTGKSSKDDKADRARKERTKTMER